MEQPQFLKQHMIMQNPTIPDIYTWRLYQPLLQIQIKMLELTHENLKYYLNISWNILDDMIYPINTKSQSNMEIGG